MQWLARAIRQHVENDTEGLLADAVQETQNIASADDEKRDTQKAMCGPATDLPCASRSDMTRRIRCLWIAVRSMDLDVSHMEGFFVNVQKLRWRRA